MKWSSRSSTAFCVALSLLLTRLAFAQTWVQTSLPLTEYICVAASADGNVLMAGTYSGPIYITTNSGVAWDTLSPPIPSTEPGSFGTAHFGRASFAQQMGANLQPFLLRVQYALLQIREALGPRATLLKCLASWRPRLMEHNSRRLPHTAPCLVYTCRETVGALGSRRTPPT